MKEETKFNKTCGTSREILKVILDELLSCNSSASCDPFLSVAVLFWNIWLIFFHEYIVPTSVVY